MKQADQLKIETDKLQAKIKESIDEFIEEFGFFEISINVRQHYETLMNGEKCNLGSYVKVKISLI